MNSSGEVSCYRRRNGLSPFDASAIRHRNKGYFHRTNKLVGCRCWDTPGLLFHGCHLSELFSERVLLLGRVFLSDSLHIWKGAAAVPGCSAVPKYRCWSPKQTTCAITTEAPAARTQRRADTAMLLWGPKRSGSALAVGFAFRCIDVVLNGDTVFYLSGFFQLVRYVSANYR